MKILIPMPMTVPIPTPDSFGLFLGDVEAKEELALALFWLELTIIYFRVDEWDLEMIGLMQVWLRCWL